MPHTVREQGSRYAIVDKNTGKVKDKSKTKKRKTSARIRDQRANDQGGGHGAGVRPPPPAVDATLPWNGRPGAFDAWSRSNHGATLRATRVDCYIDGRR
jgi:hypothetical protein